MLNTKCTCRTSQGE